MQFHVSYNDRSVENRVQYFSFTRARWGCAWDARDIGIYADRCLPIQQAWDGLEFL